MAQPSGSTISNLTRCTKLPGVFPGGYTDQFIRALRFESVEGYGRSLQINRTTGATPLGSVGFYDPGDALAAVQATTDLETLTFARVAGTAQVDVADIDASGELNEQLEIQVHLRKIAIVRELSLQLINGSGSPALQGLNTYVTATSNSIDLSGAAPTLANFHDVISMVNASDGVVGTGPDALVMSWSGRKKLIALIEAAGGPGSCCFQHDETIGAPVMMFDGIPVYVTEGFPGPANSESVFALKLNGETGVRVLHVGGDPDEFGIVVDDVPNQMGVSERAKIVRGYYGVLYPEIGSVAAIVDADLS